MEPSITTAYNIFYTAGISCNMWGNYLLVSEMYYLRFMHNLYSVFVPSPLEVEDLYFVL